VESTPSRQTAAPAPETWTGRRVVGHDGARLGKLEHVHRGTGSDGPTWGVVRRGLLRRRRHFVPLQEATAEGKQVAVPVHRAHVRSAPTVPGDRQLHPDTETRLDQHYARRGAIEDTHERQRAAYGGFKIGAAFFGWLVAVGLAVLLSALLSAAGAATGLTELSSAEAEESAETIGIVGAAVLLAILAVAYFAGGYVAGRMSRFDGARQGFGAWLIGLVVTVLIAAAGAIFGDEYNLLQAIDLQPRVPVEEGALTTGGAIALGAFVLVTLLASILGGRTGERFHRKVDSVAR
jgi:hypothetical protein